MSVSVMKHLTATSPALPAALKKSKTPTLQLKTHIEVQEGLNPGRYSIIPPRN